MSVHEKMTAIADAIRGKTGKTGQLTLDQMASEIASIKTGVGGSSVEEFEIVTTSWLLATKGIPSPVVLSESDNFILYLNSDTSDMGSLVGVLMQINVGRRTITTMHQLTYDYGGFAYAKSVSDDGTRIINAVNNSIGFPGGTWKLLVWR